MKRINYIKLSLDIAMAIVFALLFNKMVLGGIVFHEVAGTAIGAAFIIHMALNWRWIKQVTLKMFSRKISVKTRIGYIVDILLLITMGITIISGIAISKTLFTNLKFGDSMVFKAAHLSVPYIALILIGIHIGLHWLWVMNVFKRIFKITSGKKTLNYIAKALVVLVLAFGIYSINNTNFFARVSSITGIFSASQVPGGDRQMKQVPNRENEQPGVIPEGNSQRKQAPGSVKNGQMYNKEEGRGEGFPGGKGLSVNALTVVSSNLGIIAVFAIAVFYIEKLLLIIKSKCTIKV